MNPYKNYIMLYSFFTMLVPLPAAAYIGPGAAVSGFGSLIAIGVALCIAVIGFLWFPLKRLIKRNKTNKVEEQNKE